MRRAATEGYRCFTIENFKLEEEVGVGRFGVVYRAKELYSNKEVALKIIPKASITTNLLYQQLQR